MIDEPEEQRQPGAQEKTCNHGEVKRGVLAAMNDVAGKAAEAERKLATEEKERADSHQDTAQKEQSAAEFAEWFHAASIKQSRYRSNGALREE
jgi:hypothetical protein